ncbi:MAG: hypothetical protein QF548_12330, partial [Acidimicrobiales bacterium]|nr:hypothetical protein [Acidimicrobiales bacterium]
MASLSEPSLGGRPSVGELFDPMLGIPVDANFGELNDLRHRCRFRFRPDVPIGHGTTLEPGGV